MPGKLRSIQIILPLALLGLIVAVAAIATMLGVHRFEAGPVALLSVFVLIAVALTAWVLHRGVAGPARQLARAADRLADGDASVRAPESGADELRRVGEAFNRMATRLAEAQRANTAQERLLDALLKALPVGVSAVSRHSGVVRFVNPAWSQIYGTEVQPGADRRDVLGRLRLRGPDGRPLAVEDLPTTEAIRTGRPSALAEQVVERPDGQRVPIVVGAVPVKIGGEGDEELVVSVVQDRRDLEQAFAETRRTGRELQALLDSVTAGVLLVTNPERRVLFANRRFEELTGTRVAPGKVVPSDHWRLERDDGSPYPEEERSIDRVMRTGQSATLSDAVLVTLDGVRTPVVVIATPVRLSDGPEFDGVVAVIQDRRDLEQAFTELREWETRFNRVTRAIGQAIYEWDLSGDRCRFSGALESVFGWTPAEIDSNARWNALTHPEDLAAARTEYAASLREGRLFDLSYRLRHRDGRWLWVRDRGEHVLDAAGRAVGMVGAVADITEQRQIELQLRQAQKLETIGTLAGGIAHDFNNQLTAVIGNLTLLEENLVSASTRDEQIRHARRAAERCAELTRGLLAFSRMLPGNPHPISINETVEETTSLLRRMLPSSVVLLVDLDRSLPPALADPGQIQQALFNLCTNARDAMPDGGTLQISTRRASITRSSGDSALASGNYVELEVSDTGVGIPPEILPRIFEPFFTTRPVGQGTGLGLAMVYGIVTHHRGRVDVESEPGRGSTFRVLLPMVTTRSDADAAPLRPASSLEGRTILVVDDEPAVRDYAARVLESAGCRVILGGTGEQGLDRLLEDPSRIHAVLMDLTMPGTPVRFVVESMRRVVPGLPIVLTSGFASHSSALDQMPALPFLQKPYPPKRLVEMMGQALSATVRSKTTTPSA